MMPRRDSLFTITSPGDSPVYIRIFSITPDYANGEINELPSVILENLKLKSENKRSTDASIQGSAPKKVNGGCILAKRVHLTLKNVIFEGCMASNNGGALFIVRWFATLRFISPTYCTSSIVIWSPLFNWEYQDYAPAHFYQKRPALRILKTLFNECKADQSGGSIYINANLSNSSGALVPRTEIDSSSFSSSAAGKISARAGFSLSLLSKMQFNFLKRQRRMLCLPLEPDFNEISLCILIAACPPITECSADKPCIGGAVVYNGLSSPTHLEIKNTNFSDNAVCNSNVKHSNIWGGSLGLYKISQGTVQITNCVFTRGEQSKEKLLLPFFLKKMYKVAYLISK